MLQLGATADVLLSSKSKFNILRLILVPIRTCVEYAGDLVLAIEQSVAEVGHLLFPLGQAVAAVLLFGVCWINTPGSR